MLRIILRLLKELWSKEKKSSVYCALTQRQELNQFSLTIRLCQARLMSIAHTSHFVRFISIHSLTNHDNKEAILFTWNGIDWPSMHHVHSIMIVGNWTFSTRKTKMKWSSYWNILTYTLSGSIKVIIRGQWSLHSSPWAWTLMQAIHL